MRVIISPAAEADITDIGDYIARDSPQAAEDVVGRLYTVCTSLSQSPRRFPVVRRRGDVEVRRAVRGSYSIYYVVQPAEVNVVHVLHAARDAEKILFPDD